MERLKPKEIKVRVFQFVLFKVVILVIQSFDECPVKSVACDGGEFKEANNKLLSDNNCVEIN